MAIAKMATAKWYKCPYCWNYSLQPMECCGINMVEEEEDEEEMIIMSEGDN